VVDVGDERVDDVVKFLTVRSHPWVLLVQKVDPEADLKISVLTDRWTRMGIIGTIFEARSSTNLIKTRSANTFLL
jgi:hypothetical protein